MKQIRKYVLNEIALKTSLFPNNGGNGNGGNEGGYHPFIQGLLATLPKTDEWAIAEQAKWLQTAASIFGLIYKSEGHIKITPQEKD